MRYSEALWADRWTILGVRLQPLCLGHALLLQRLGIAEPSAFSLQPSAFPLGDLLLGLYICSRSVARAGAGLQRASTRRWLALRAWAVRLLPARIRALALARYAQYLAAGWQGPRVWLTQKDGGRPRGAELLQILTVSLMANLGLDRAAALETPLSLALWDCCAFWESEAALEFVSEEDEDLIAEAKRIAAREFAAQDPLPQPPFVDPPAPERPQRPAGHNQQRQDPPVRDSQHAKCAQQQHPDHDRKVNDP